VCLPLIAYLPRRTRIDRMVASAGAHLDFAFAACGRPELLERSIDWHLLVGYGTRHRTPTALRWRPRARQAGPWDGRESLATAGTADMAVRALTADAAVIDACGIGRGGPLFR
jgi:hypothetical protein